MMSDLVRLPTAPRRVVFTPALTARRLDLLRAIAAFVQEHRYAPTIRQLMELTAARSTSSVNWHLNVLERAAYVTFDRDHKGSMVTRSLALTDKGREVIEL